MSLKQRLNGLYAGLPFVSPRNRPRIERLIADLEAEQRAATERGKGRPPVLIASPPPPNANPAWREPDFSAHNLPARPSYGRVSRPDPAFSVTGVSAVYRDG